MIVRIDAEPFVFRLPLGSTALILIDMQKDFLDPGGFGAALGNDVSRLQPAVAACARLLAIFRACKMPVLHTREVHRPDLSDCPVSKRTRGNPALRIGDDGPMGRVLIAGEPGAAIVADCAPAYGERVIDKPGKGAFYNTDLATYLAAHQITTLVFGGVTTEVCVQTTMREANDRGYECLLVEEATESYFPEFKQATLAMIRAQGAIVGWTASLSAVEKSLEHCMSSSTAG
ncbi:MAG: cysteine hydrolase [Rhodospirillales bacterium]|nr:cysteine hydrolase [Rhodospirillales bacterium]